MQIFGIDLWRIILCVVLIFIVVKRANLVAIFAKRAFGKGENEKAIKIYKVAGTVGNLNVGNKLTYAYILLRSGEVDDALFELNKLLPYTRANTDMRYRVKNLIALTYWKQGKLDDAIEELEEIFADGFKKTLFYQNLGMLYNLSDDTEKALRFNEEAYEFNSDDIIILDNLADANRRSGNLRKAEELYEEMMAKENKPKFPEAYLGYAKVLAETGKKEKAIEMAEEALTKPFNFLSAVTKEEAEEILKEYKG